MMSKRFLKRYPLAIVTDKINRFKILEEENMNSEKKGGGGRLIEPNFHL